MCWIQPISAEGEQIDDVGASDQYAPIRWCSACQIYADAPYDFSEVETLPLLERLSGVPLNGAWRNR